MSVRNTPLSISGDVDDKEGEAGLTLTPAEAATVDASYLTQLTCALLLMLSMLHAGWQVRSA